MKLSTLIPIFQTIAVVLASVIAKIPVESRQTLEIRQDNSLPAGCSQGFGQLDKVAQKLLHKPCSQTEGNACFSPVNDFPFPPIFPPIVGPGPTRRSDLECKNDICEVNDVFCEEGKACASNEDCPAIGRCRSSGVCSDEGLGITGNNCGNDADCAGILKCASNKKCGGDLGNSYMPCESTAECSAGLICSFYNPPSKGNAANFICRVRPEPKGYGAVCTTNEDCNSSSCSVSHGGQMFCGIPPNPNCVNKCKSCDSDADCCEELVCRRSIIAGSNDNKFCTNGGIAQFFGLDC